jgi:TolA-binding protein
MSPKKRMRKHDLKEDHFVTATLQFTTYIREHQNIFLTAAAGIVVVAILVTVISSSHKHSQETADRLLGEAEILYGQGSLAQTVDQCDMILEQYGSSAEAGMAAFYKADSQLKLQRYQEAIESFQLYIDKYHRDKTLAAASYTGIAACHEQLEEFAPAGDNYLSAAEKYPGYYGAAEALLGAGRCYAAAGEKEKAREAYQLLIDSYAQSRQASVAKMALATLEASSG